MQEIWWQRKDLGYKGQELYFAGEAISYWCQGLQLPLFLYSGARINDNIARLQNALNKVDRPCRLLYAMKANHNSSVLNHIRQSGLGIDACSPKEVSAALSCGFHAKDISLTGILSPKELIELGAVNDLQINVDSLSALATIGRHFPEREIGIRINPQAASGATNNSLLQYSGDKISKFGIYRDELEEALTIVEQHQLHLKRAHMHLGCGLSNQGLAQFHNAMRCAREMVDRIPGINQVNLGGGLGVPHLPSEAPLALKAWTGIINDTWGDSPYQLIFEPGEYLVKDAGMLLLNVNYDEVKAGKRFVFLAGGFNLAKEPAFYQLPCYPISTKLPGKNDAPADVVGNINEALDIWYEQVPLPPMHVGDIVALLNSGAYAAEMSSNHCMRGDFMERFIST